jgi:MATE family multidrug resistance protein
MATPKKLSYHIQKTLVLAFPIMLSQLSHMLIGLSDTFLVGHLGSVPLAGVALGNSIFSLVLVGALGLTFSLTPLVAKADGENNEADAVGYLKNAILLFTLIGIVAVGLGYGVAYNLDVFQQKEEVVAQTIIFLGPFMASLLPIMVYQAFKQFIEGLGYTKPAMIINLSSAVLNIGLAVCFINGYLGFPKLGVLGIGLAGLIDRTLMMLTMIIYTLSRKEFRKYTSKLSSTAYSWSYSMSLLKMGLPISIQMVMEIACFAAGGILVGTYGAIPLAAHQVALSMAAATYMAASGIGTAASIRIGNYLGQKNYVELRNAGIVSIWLTIAFMTITSLMFVIFRNMLPGLFSDDSQVIEIAAGLLIFAAVFQISDGIQACTQGCLRGIQDVTMPTIIVTISYWVLGIPVGYLLSQVTSWSFYSIWVGLCSGLFFASTLLVIRFLKISKYEYLKARFESENPSSFTVGH